MTAILLASLWMLARSAWTAAGARSHISHVRASRARSGGSWAKVLMRELMDKTIGSIVVGRISVSGLRSGVRLGAWVLELDVLGEIARWTTYIAARSLLLSTPDFGVTVWGLARVDRLGKGRRGCGEGAASSGVEGTLVLTKIEV